MKRLFAAAALFCLSAAPAHATTFIFKGDGGLYDTPTGNIANDCGTTPLDLCTDEDALGFTYSKDSVEFTARAFANGVVTTLIQDIDPENSGLGALSEGTREDDQTQFNAGESIEFIFTNVVNLFDIEFNAGNDVDCSSPGPEGPCGDFDLFIDDIFFDTITAIDLLPDVFTGQKFSFVAKTPDAGFAIAQFTVIETPLPAALPLLLAGLGGIAFAARRRKA